MKINYFRMCAAGSMAAMLISAGIVSCKEDKPEETRVAVESVSVAPTSRNLVVGGKVTLQVTVLPENASDKSVTWESSNSAVAKVSSAGEVEALSTGTTQITVKSKADASKTAVCAVEVIAEPIPVESVTLSEQTLRLAVGDSATLTATILPSTATNMDVSWSSNNPAVATVTNGKVKALTEGTATVTVTTADGSKKATCTVTVAPLGPLPVTGVSLDNSTLTLLENGATTLTATVSPEGAANKAVTWESNNESVVTVDNDGNLTAGTEGTATVTVTTADGGKKAECAVTVINGIAVSSQYGKDTIRLVNVAGGSFTMGCSEQSGCGNNETPPHTVNLSAFKIGKFEVTQKLWKTVMGSLPNDLASTTNPTYVNADYPVFYVKYTDITSFLTKLNTLTSKNFRLPTEAEWEYAARGGSANAGTTIYSGSNTLDEVAWYTGNSTMPGGPVSGEPHKVGTKNPNELGIHDMSGSVAEWCYDYADSYDSNEQTDPTGPSSSPLGNYRVYRGGNYREAADLCRVDKRQFMYESYKENTIGFRLVISQ